jgi:hypothetical protein
VLAQDSKSAQQRKRKQHLTKIMKWINVYKTQASQIKINGTPKKSLF